MKLTIPIFFVNDYNASLEDLGLKTDIRNSDVRDVTFFNINYVSTYICDGVEYGLIGCNNEDLISPITREQILKLIERND